MSALHNERAAHGEALLAMWSEMQAIVARADSVTTEVESAAPSSGTTSDDAGRRARLIAENEELRQGLAFLKDALASMQQLGQKMDQLHERIVSTNDALRDTIFMLRRDEAADALVDAYGAFSDAVADDPRSEGTRQALIRCRTVMVAYLKLAENALLEVPKERHATS